MLYVAGSEFVRRSGIALPRQTHLHTVSPPAAGPLTHTPSVNLSFFQLYCCTPDEQVFGKMFTEGHIFRGRKPVNWSPSSRTALAEAELEYPAGHTSTSVYAAFEVGPWG